LAALLETFHVSGATARDCYRVMAGDELSEKGVHVGWVHLPTARSVQLSLSRKGIRPSVALPEGSGPAVWLWCWAFENDTGWPVSKDGARRIALPRTGRGGVYKNDMLLPVKAVRSGHLADGLRALQEAGEITCRIPGYRRKRTVRLTRLPDGTGLVCDVDPGIDHSRILLTPARKDEQNILPTGWPEIATLPKGSDSLTPRQIEAPGDWSDLAALTRWLLHPRPADRP
jgi:hypothetical protein